MGSERGAANLAQYNAERSATVLPLLTRELQLCRKRKLEFKTPGLLAAYLADRLKLARTTLTRNPKYMGPILAHHAGQPGVVSRTPDSTSDPAILQAKLAAAKLDASNTREALASASAQLERVQGSGFSGASTGDYQVAFADLAMVLVILLHRFPEFIQLDRQRRVLIDMTAKPSAPPIAGKERLSEFVTWLELNQALPLVGSLVLGNKPKA